MTDWLIDKSALGKLPQSPDYEVWLDRINCGKVWAGLPTKLDVAVSARDPQHWPTLRQHLLEPLLDDRINQVYGKPVVEWLAL